MKYGITKVVGGWSRQLNAEELIPYTLARTAREHKVLRKLLADPRENKFREAIEIGCGYGRNLHFLKEISHNVAGLERDKELAFLAANINLDCSISSPPEMFPTKFKSSVFDLVLTFTFLQHLSDDEARTAANEILRIACKGATIVIVEETDQGRNYGPDCIHRDLSSYRDLFRDCKLVHTEPRIVENGLESGTYMVFRR